MVLGGNMERSLTDKIMDIVLLLVIIEAVVIVNIMLLFIVYGLVTGQL